MHKFRILLLLALPLLSESSSAQPGLCGKREVTEWSCAAKGKIYALCSSRDLGPITGYMQYRAGTSSKLEFAFPQPLTHPKGHFLLRLAPKGASLSFSNEGYEYFIYESLAGSTTIDINKGQMPVGSIICASATDTLTLAETQNRFKLLGIYQ